MKRVVTLLTAVTLAACGNGTTTTNGKYDQTQTPVTPKGSITARVIDGSNYQPLSDVAITVAGTTASLTTDANGLATFGDAVVESNYLFIAEKAGYLRQSVSTSISGSAGNSPLAGSVTTFTVTLYKADASVKGYVFLPNGQPAKSATVYIDERNQGAGDGVATAQTGMDGSFMLTGLASRPQGFNYQIYALWFDENGDGQPDYPSTNSSFNALPGQTARVFITYQQNLAQRVIASNIFDGALVPATDISLQFALPVQNTNFNGSAATAFQLTNLTRSTNVAVTATWSNDTQVAIKPVSALAIGERYRLDISVTNANASGQNVNPNFGASYNFQVRPDAATSITAQVTNLSLQNASPINTSTQALTQYDWNSNFFKLQWDGVSGAVSYQVYAKDTKQNPDWVFVATVTATGATRLITNVSLPNSFDMIPGGANQPLAGGNSVTFTVVPVDIYGNTSPLATSPTQAAADNTQPTWTSSFNPVTYSAIYGSVDAINDETTAATLLFRLTSSEPMDPASPPVFTGTYNGTGALSTAWAWDATNFAFTMTLTIPAGGEAVGNFLVRGGKDMAGNLVLNGDQQGSLGGYKELVNHGNFEEGTGCATTGWNPTNSGGMPAPTAILATGQSGRCSAVVGAPTGTAAATGVSRIAQDVTLTTIPAMANWSFVYRSTVRGQTVPGGTPGYQYCRIATADGAETQIALLYGQKVDGTANTSTTTVGPSPFTPGANTSVRIICEVNNTAGTPQASNTSLYLDDVGLALYKPGTL